MVVHSQFSAISSGLIPIFNQSRLPFQNRKYNGRKFSNFNGVKVVVSSRRILRGRGSIRKSCSSGFGTNYVVRMGRDSYQSTFDDDLPQEPFPLTLVKEFIWGIRSLLAFLVEQPSQLKYIEWPGFSSTLRTATLTLVLVALLIVALSSIDSALSYLLAILLRRML
ncbi:hypothetical protein L484_006066 [Morus notabilis]|uniref:Uncharacterized protein n=1 Tax=Morus notabilis TaxID=981085 RepID=W9QLA0_9ROSA|nr:uncharacterized protein LOC21389512 [Morus notabilis]XP_024033125.1 uncharacterized protein LOC21389512 [Morus notabilis]EXB24034.1 hypothetical protein L484_006066 [Morus notabilis]